MREYTEKIHRQRVAKMIQGKDPCKRCPAMPYYMALGGVQRYWGNNPCAICEAFISSSHEGYLDRCPCYKHGKEKAIELTISALKKKGDL